MNEWTSYLGYRVLVKDAGYVVDAGGTRVPFTSMSAVRAFIREMRKDKRREQAA